MAHQKVVEHGIQKWTLKITGAGEDIPRQLMAFGPGCGGNVMYIAHPRSGKAVMVLAIGKGKQETATIWTNGTGRAPNAHPPKAIAIGEAVAALKALKGELPDAGPTVMKGTWSGVLICDNGAVRVELRRKVVSYGTIKLVSHPHGEWSATFDREKRWFTEAAQKTVVRDGLAECIQAGAGLVIGLVSDACSFRDTHRRGAVDPEHAAKHPPKPAREPKDTSEKYIAKRTGVPTLKSVSVEAPCPTCVDGMDKAVVKVRADAAKLGAAVNLDDVKDAPAYLTRAANLIRRAGALLESPLCKGREKAGALSALKQAIETYNEARKAYTTEHDAQIELVTKLRRISERASLAAAKIGRSCHAGQTALPFDGAPAAKPSKAAPKAAPVTGARPPNAYMVFSQRRVPELRAGGMSMKEAMVQAGVEWRARSGSPAASPKPSPRASGDASKPAARTPKAPRGGNAAADAKISAAVQSGLRSIVSELRAGAV